MKNFAGDTESDVRVWNSYVRAARDALLDMGASPISEVPALIDSDENLLTVEQRKCLRTILFTSFLLEYRLKRVLISMGKRAPPRTTLGQLLRSFWSHLETVERLDGRGSCICPLSWAEVSDQLGDLLNLRNTMAHGTYEDVLRYFSNTDLRTDATRLYSAVIRAIAITNVATGYSNLSEEAELQTMAPVRFA